MLPNPIYKQYKAVLPNCLVLPTDLLEESALQPQELAKLASDFNVIQAVELTLQKDSEDIFLTEAFLDHCEPIGLPQNTEYFDLLQFYKDDELVLSLPLLPGQTVVGLTLANVSKQKTNSLKLEKIQNGTYNFVMVPFKSDKQIVENLPIRTAKLETRLFTELSRDEICDYVEVEECTFLEVSMRVVVTEEQNVALLLVYSQKLGNFLSLLII